MSARLQEARDALADARSKREECAPSLFDEVTSTDVEVRPEVAAIASVSRNAGREWQDHVVEIIRRVALAHDELTVDDVTPRIELPVHDLRAVGGAMQRAAREGVIARTGQFKISERLDTHSRPLRVWRSCLYDSRCAS